MGERLHLLVHVDGGLGRVRVVAIKEPIGVVPLGAGHGGGRHAQFQKTPARLVISGGGRLMASLVAQVALVLVPWALVVTVLLTGPALVLRVSARARLRLRTWSARCGVHNTSTLWSVWVATVLVGAVLWQEVGTHYAHACRGSGTTRVLVVADPQLVDRYAYPELPDWAHWWLALLCDVQLRRSLRAARARAQPAAVVVLGDLLWGPTFMRPEEWASSSQRLARVFGPLGQRPGIAVPTLAIMGNHDSGMYLCALQSMMMQRWIDTVGPPHWTLTLSNLTLVGLSNPLLQDNCPGSAAVRDETEQWLRALGAEYALPRPGAPRRVLLTHIPLFCRARYDGTCGGPMRRRDFRLRMGSGVGYENVLNPVDTSLVLDTVRPHRVLSGDAHDLCQVTLDNGITDTTLPSFSWLEGAHVAGQGGWGVRLTAAQGRYTTATPSLALPATATTRLIFAGSRPKLLSTSRMQCLRCLHWACWLWQP